MYDYDILCEKVKAEHKKAEEREQHKYDEEILKKQFKHDIRMAILNGAIGLFTGAASGLIASIIYNIIVNK